MAKITANQRANLIAADQTKAQKDWAVAASTINRLTLELKEYAAWKNHNYLNDKSDFDSEDIETLNNQFSEVFGSLQANMATLTDIGAIPNADLAIYEANNNQYIADNSIDVDEYDKRYQV